ncbi:GAF and ANTAR domain-containing protein [Mycobacterium camsae]|uniref:GAF and ANTAR domain-containing protein n=1 Tax=Mycobacterium gordonae TaxID=1778 RepID=UPI0019808A60|nr:GAF and ANTAR domain-containing protein [Mycobacterium gordonae]
MGRRQLTEEGRGRDVHHRIADLARSLHDSPPAAADTVAQRVVEYAVYAVDAAQYAGITLVTPSSEVQTPASTHHYPRLLDEIQDRHKQGPCFVAAWHQHTIRITDLSGDNRWPRYQRDALAAAPVRSIVSFRLFASEHTMGALNLYADEPGAFDEAAEEIGYVLATHAALAWDTVRREDNFLSALASRDVIGQAKGILMARFNINAIQAFELLKRLSQERNMKLVDVAHQITRATNIGDI